MEDQPTALLGPGWLADVLNQSPAANSVGLGTSISLELATKRAVLVLAKTDVGFLWLAFFTFVSRERKRIKEDPAQGGPNFRRSNCPQPLTSPDPKVPKKDMGMGQNSATRNRTAGFSPCFHLPGFHFGYRFWDPQPGVCFVATFSRWFRGKAKRRYQIPFNHQTHQQGYLHLSHNSAS